MTEQVQTKEKPNPYNAKKDWHDEDKPFSSSDNLYFEEPVDKNKLFTADFSAKKLLELIDSLDVKDSGKLFSWNGDEIQP